MAIQRSLIRYLLDPLAKITSRIPQKQKDAGFVVFFLCIIALFIGRGAGFLNFRYAVFFVLGCLSLGGMILCTLPERCKPIPFRKSLTLLWFGIGGLMLLSGVFYNFDHIPEALLFLVVYPLIFLIWNQSDYTKIFKLLLRGIELSFWLYTLACLLFSPVNSVRYSGLFTNFNGTAGYLAIVATCLLVDCLLFEKITLARIRKVIAFGICFALLLYTGSRTGLLEIAAVCAVATVIGLIQLWKLRKLSFFRNILLLTVCAALCFYATMPVLQFGHSVKNGVVSFVQSAFTEAPDNTDPDSTDPSTPSQPSIRPGDSADLIGDRLDTEGKDLNHISTGRFQIWAGYVKQLNLFGHRDSGTVTFQYNDIEKTYHTTHMTVLQIAYENGAIAGILYLAFNLTAGVYSLIYALRHKNDPYAMVPLLVSVAYCLYSLLANTGISFWYLTTLMYYLVQFPIMAKQQISTDSEEKQVDAQ